MANYFAKNTGSDLAAGTSDGTAWGTFKYLFETATTGVNTLALKRGDVFDEDVDVDGASPTAAGSGWTLDCYGDSSKPLPVVTRAKRNCVWVSATGGTYATDLTGNRGGVVVEDGRTLNYVEWTTNIATTAALMGPGSFTFDPINFIYYIKPRTGTPNEHRYAVSAGVYGLVCTNRNNWTIRNIEFKESSAGIHITGGSGWIIENTIHRDTGGWYGVSGTAPQGDAILVDGSVGGVKPCYIINNKFYDIFDAAAYPQSYNNSETLFNIIIKNNVAVRCGLFGFGAAVIGSGITGSTINAISVENNIAEDIGTGWAGNRGGHGFHFTSASTQASSSLGGCSFLGNIARRCYIGMTVAGGAGGENKVQGNTIEFPSIYGIFITSDTNKATVNISGNVLEGSTGTGVRIQGDNSGIINVFNNTLVGTWTSGLYNLSSNGTVQSKNNIFSYAGIGIEDAELGGTITSDNDLFNCTTSAVGLTPTNSVEDDPDLDSNKDITTTSPCYEAGVFLSTSRDSSVRKLRNSPDIGARQYRTPRTSVSPKNSVVSTKRDVVVPARRPNLNA